MTAHSLLTMRYLVRERLFHIKDDFWVTDADGNRAFFVNAKVLSLRHTLEFQDAIDLADGGPLEAVGNIIGKDFEIRDGHRVLARTSRAWFRVRDTYGVDVVPGENDALMLCIAVCLDRIHADEEAARR